MNKSITRVMSFVVLVSIIFFVRIRIKDYHDKKERAAQCMTQAQIDFDRNWDKECAWLDRTPSCSLPNLSGSALNAVYNEQVNECSISWENYLNI